jgi:hypothetical protein
VYYAIIRAEYVYGFISTYYFVEISAPPKAKSQSCVLQESGEVRPGLRPQPVRYSIQFGPPSAVPVYYNVQ